jgi:hypothetical protein
MAFMTRVAWVESPLQLVNAVEYAALTGEPLRIFLRARARQLHDTAKVIAPHLPPGVTIGGRWHFAFLSPFMLARERLVGDPYSGQFRLATAMTGVRDLVVVDDGTAMMGFAEQVRTATALRRSGKSEGKIARRLGEIASLRLHHTLDHGVMRAFTAYDDKKELMALGHAGATIVHNKYKWVRKSKFVKDNDAMETVVLGSALHDDGFIKGGPYRAWIREQVAAGARVYFPHRREDTSSLERYSDIPKLNVRKAQLPIEIVLASSRNLSTVITLPTSVVATLRNILPEGVQMRVCPVPEDWLTAKADDEVRTKLRRVEEAGGVHEAA